MVSLLERPRLGELLRQRGLTDTQIREGLAEQERGSQDRRERLGRCLVRLGHVSETHLLEALGEQLGLDVVDVARADVPAEARDRIPVDFVREHQVLPLSCDGGELRVATAEPARGEVIEDLRVLTGLEIVETLAPSRDISERITECYELTVERLIRGLESDDGAGPSRDTLHEIEVLASEPTVVNLVNATISGALKARASDVHFVPFESTIELRYRIDGVLHDVAPPPRHLHAALISRVKIMAEMNIAERFIPQDGHFQIQHAGRRVDVRVGTMPTVHGESLVMRLLEKDSEVLTLEELGLDRERAESISSLLTKPHGIFLSTGPTGSGKTTTLYSILSSIYTKERKILTLEDPVEYELEGVTQIPVRPARGFTFATGLRAILRQDPDVIMVGEIRDSETAEIAIRAALTGHLVFSTLHTNDAAGAVTRLLDMGAEAFLIASSLEAVIAQRLVRTICSSCRAEIDLDDEAAERLRVLGVAETTRRAFAGAGCDDCRGTGYRGRTALFEVLVMTPSLRELVLARRPSTEIQRAARSDMVTMRDAALQKIHAGETTADEVLRVAAWDVDS